MRFPFLTTVAMTLALTIATEIYPVTTQANSQSTQVAEAFLNNLERKNTDGLEQLFTADATFEAFNTRVEGRKATLEQLLTGLESFDRLDFSNERISMGQDNRTVLVEAQGRYTLKQTGVTVQNSFALVLQLNRNNQITAIQAQMTPFVRVRESNTAMQIIHADEQWENFRKLRIL
ncbi:MULTISPECIES: nuclear transport factor 2 family protein [Nostocales]|uniref:Nuclear transport factor 2 family protein n=2 Tax=Nostocales TaxID=1161 RepID=A0A0C1ND53_9CYAN|nr:nuclear transport factor 2 family protein [Tolypothrix bouteillei]KAF3886664.1 nuclear transport factor 2 family protein [Tolypothrix bouteillei VB521301]